MALTLRLGRLHRARPRRPRCLEDLRGTRLLTAASHRGDDRRAPLSSLSPTSPRIPAGPLRIPVVRAGRPHQAKSRLFSSCPQDLEGDAGRQGGGLQSNVRLTVAADAVDRHLRCLGPAFTYRIPDVVPTVPRIISAFSPCFYRHWGDS